MHRRESGPPALNNQMGGKGGMGEIHPRSASLCELVSVSGGATVLPNDAPNLQRIYVPFPRIYHVA